MAITKIQVGAIPDASVTHAKLHTTMDLSSKTVTLPTINALDVTNNISVGGTVDGIDIATRDAILTSTTTTADAALPKAGGAMTGGITSTSDITVGNAYISSGYSQFTGLRVPNNGYIGCPAATSMIQFQGSGVTHIPGASTIGGTLAVTGTVTANGLDVNSGAGNVAATFTSTDGTAAIKLVDSSGNCELSTSGGGFNIQPAGGASKVIVSSAGDLNVMDGGKLKVFRAGSSEAAELYMDTGETLYINNTWGNKKIVLTREGNVGIGTNDPAKDLQVAFSDSTTTNLNSGAGVLINNTNTDTGTLAPLLFSTDSGTRVRSAIAHVDTGGYGKGDLAFYTMSDGDNSGSTIDTSDEAMRIDSSGNVGIGNSNPSSALEIGNGSSTYVTIRNASSGDVASGYNIKSGSTTTTSLYGNAAEGWTTLLSGGSLGFRVNQAAAGFNPMNIDTSGRVTTPYQPSFGARSLSNAQSGAGTTGTNHTLVFSSATNNTGNHYSTSTGLFTAPVAGRYFVTFSGLYNASNNNTGPVYLMHNGTEKYRAYHHGSGSYYEQVSVSGVLSVAANDTISVYSVIAGWHIGGETSFSGFLIG